MIDGAAYHFHATFALVQDPVRYRQVRTDYSGPRVDMTFRPTQIALFYYDDDTFALSTFMTYRVLPLGQPGDSHQI